MQKSAALFAGLAVIVLAGLYFALRPHPETARAPTAASAPSPLVFNFRVAGGKRVEGPGRIQVKTGDMVSLHIESDVADELHVHGYDMHVEVRRGNPAILVFRCDRSGRFDVELHHADLQLATLEVMPR